MMSAYESGESTVEETKRRRGAAKKDSVGEKNPFKNSKKLSRSTNKNRDLKGTRKMMVELVKEVKTKRIG